MEKYASCPPKDLHFLFQTGNPWPGIPRCSAGRIEWPRLLLAPGSTCCVVSCPARYGKPGGTAARICLLTISRRGKPCAEVLVVPVATPHFWPLSTDIRVSPVLGQGEKRQALKQVFKDQHRSSSATEGLSAQPRCYRLDQRACMVAVMEAPGASPLVGVFARS